MDVNPMSVLMRHGFKKTLQLLGGLAFRPLGSYYRRIKHRNAEQYFGPTDDELVRIEEMLVHEGITLSEITIDLNDYKCFQEKMPFPADYHGGRGGGAWNEKILEHYISYKLLALAEFNQNDIYADIAAGGSPWAMLLRLNAGVQSFALDVNLRPPYDRLQYYRPENAVKTSFQDSSVRGISLHCAYEVFEGNDDIDLLKELGRILQPGGKAIILPLYMHTHYCSYASPEFFGKGFSAAGAREYINWKSCGVHSSRKYNVQQLTKRVLDVIFAAGMKYRILVLRNKKDIAADVYCHFILEIIK